MPRDLLVQLADGCIHSGEMLGASLGISRAAVGKQIKKLIESGLAIECIKGAGYKLVNPSELLDRDAIIESLDPQLRDAVSEIEILWTVTSTNTYCVNVLKEKAINRFVCLAEQQVSGRGRRGRAWVSSPCGSLCMSMGWQFSGGPEALDGLSLAVAVAVANSLRHEFLIDDVRLKWPNDIYVGKSKLGGILIELTGEIGGACSAVIGIGLNVQSMDFLSEKISQSWVAMESLLGVNVSRNKLAAAIINRLIPMLEENQAGGFSKFYGQWREYDALIGSRVVVQSGGDNYIEGVAAGISESGEFLLEVDGVRRVFKSGEVSLRHA